MKENVIVSLADANYFELLNELVDSIKRFDQSKEFDICIMDAGLEKNQIEILEKKVHKIKKAKWDIEVPSFKIKGREWLKSQVSRAFLPDYFPDYKKYLWIDADAWVNSWESIELYIRGCENKKLAISTSADRSYGRVLRAEWFFGSFAKIKSQNYKHAKSSGFSEKISREVALKPHLNIGLFSLEENAPHWEVWQKNLKKALSSGKIWGSEQIAMNITIYSDNLDVEILPAYCNWTLIEALKFDKKQNTFVEPYLPNHEIGIIHLAGKNNDTIRNDKNYISHAVSGGINYKNINKCFDEQKKIFDQLKRKFTNQDLYEDTLINLGDQTGESKVHTISFFFKNGDSIRVECYAYGKKYKTINNFADSLIISIVKKEVSDWFTVAN